MHRKKSAGESHLRALSVGRMAFFSETLKPDPGGGNWRESWLINVDTVSVFQKRSQFENWTKLLIVNGLLLIFQACPSQG